MTAPSKESLEAAVKKIEELMEQSFAPAPQTSTSRPLVPHVTGVIIIIIIYIYIIYMIFFFKKKEINEHIFYFN